MKQIEQTITSVEVAEMVEKTHANLLKDIRRYCKQLGEVNIDFSDFFKESTYCTEQKKELPCYDITKKGCEFIAHKLTGVKGTAFTARGNLAAFDGNMAVRYNLFAFRVLLAQTFHLHSGNGRKIFCLDNPQILPPCA